MMTIEDIKSEVRIHNDVAITFDIVKEIPEFQIGTEARGYMAALAWMATKERVMEYNFNNNKFEEWCEENGYQCMIDEYNRMVRIRNRK